jgi:hypothetical protein
MQHQMSEVPPNNKICFQPTPCSLGLSATSQQYFSLRINQPPTLFSWNKPASGTSHQPPAKRTGRNCGDVVLFTRTLISHCQIYSPSSVQNCTIVSYPTKWQIIRGARWTDRCGTTVEASESCCFAIRASSSKRLIEVDSMMHDAQNTAL